MANAKRDSKGHVLAAWDDHISCHNCLKQMGICCSRNTPCQVCAKWDEATWQCMECAIQEKEKRKSRNMESSSSEAPIHSPLGKKSKSSKQKGESSGKTHLTSANLPTLSRIPVLANSTNGSLVKPAHSSQATVKKSALAGKVKSGSDSAATIPLMKPSDRLAHLVTSTPSSGGYKLNTLDSPATDPLLVQPCSASHSLHSSQLQYL